MENNLLIMIITAHILGDFYLQTNKIALLKAERLKGLVLHGFLYSIPYFVIFLCSVKSFAVAFALCCAVAIHFAIDFLKYLFIKIIRKKKPHLIQQKDGTIYLIDQGIHLLTILLICFCIGPTTLRPIDLLQDFLAFIHLQSMNSVKWLLLILIINKPVNITFDKIFSSYQPVLEDVEVQAKETIILRSASIEKSRKNSAFSNNLSKGNSKTGAAIGFLERTLILIFINIGQFSAIGLILTAKSIARYEMISKNQEFGEYYLIGTLTSVLSAIIIYYAIM